MQWLVMHLQGHAASVPSSWENDSSVWEVSAGRGYIWYAAHSLFLFPRSGACARGHAFVRLCARAHSDVLPSLMLIGWDPLPLTSAISYTAGFPAAAAVRSSSGRKFCV